MCYFKTVDTALEFGRLLYAALPEFPYDPAVWGRQLVMDENDEVLRTVDKLLTGAVSMDIYEVKAACEALGGRCCARACGKGTATRCFQYLDFFAGGSALCSR